MKNILLLLTIFSSITVACGQQFNKTFGGASPDYFYSGQQTADGGFIMAGYTQSFGAGLADVYLVKTNASGDTLWTKTYGGADDDRGNAVQQTADGGYIITGLTKSFGAGAYDVYVIKTDAVGDTLWTKTYGGTTNDQGNAVRQTADGGYVIAGATLSFGGSMNLYLIKTDATGNVSWTKTYGGAEIDYAYSISLTTDGGYMLGGYMTNFSNGWTDVYLVKTDSVGNFLWDKTYGGSQSDQTRSIQQTKDGGYIAAGFTNSYGSGGYDVYLIKTNSIGDTLWTKTYGGVNDDYGFSVQQTLDSGYIVTGFTNSIGTGINLVYLIKTDALGDTLWTRTFDGLYGGSGYCVQQIADGGYCIYGRAGTSGPSDASLIRTDANGNTSCNQGISNTIIKSTPTIVTVRPTTVLSGCVVGNPSTKVGSGGTVTDMCASVGIAENRDVQTVSISPNLFASTTTITTNETFNNATLTVFNNVGQVVKQIKNISGQTYTFHRENLPSGLYFINLTDENKTFLVSKLVISNK